MILSGPGAAPAPGPAPLAAKAATAGVVVAIAGYPLASSMWLPHVVCDVLAFVLPAVSFIAVTAVYLLYRRSLPPVQRASLRTAVLCSAALLVSVVVLLSTSLPYIRGNVASPR